MPMMRHVKRLGTGRRPKIDFGQCWRKGCGRDAIVRINDLGACPHHLDQLVREQAARVHAAYRRRVNQEVAR